MEYAALVAVYEELAATDSRNELRDRMAALFREADPDVLAVLVRLVRGTAFADWEDADLGVSTKLTREAIARATGTSPETIEDYWRETGDLGNAAARAVRHRSQRTLVDRRLDVETVYGTLRDLASYEGRGSQERRVDAIAGLVSAADPDEATYVVRTVVGAMRLGVGAGTVRAAIAAAFLDGSDAAEAAVERAVQVTNDHAVVAEAAREGGLAALEALDVEPFQPVKVMLARKADSLAEAIEEVAGPGESILWEHKLDGVRTQLHLADGEVAVYTRRASEVTAQFPEVVAAVEDHVGAQPAILEGEIVAYDPEDGSPLPFQELSRRVKREQNVAAVAEEVPVRVALFDALLVDGETLLDARLAERLDALAGAVSFDGPVLERVPHRRTGEEPAARAFYEDTLDAGHEGVVAKNLAATYQPGRRVGYMMKVKPVMEPLDLVVTRAMYSEGRRRNQLGRLYLGCRDGEDFAEVGRMARGFTDAELAAVTERLDPLITEVDGREVDVEPELVVEVEYEEVQASPEYDSGYALRFPRFRRIREDLAPADADDLETVAAVFDEQRD